MAKIIKTGDEARNLLKNGIKTINDAVKITLGPKGKNVVLDRKYTSPLVTNDGVTIAIEIEVENPFENMSEVMRTLDSFLAGYTGENSGRYAR